MTLAYRKYIKYRTKYTNLKYDNNLQMGGSDNLIIAFDFSKTITRIPDIELINVMEKIKKGYGEDLTKFHRMPDRRSEAYPEKIISNAFLNDKFKKLLLKLRSHGNHIVIITDSPKELVDYILKFYNLDQYFNIIKTSNITLDEYKKSIHQVKIENKNNILEDISRELNQNDKHKIMLIDSKISCVYWALTEGYYAILSGANGFELSQMTVINKFINGNLKLTDDCISIIDPAGNCPPGHKYINWEGIICCKPDGIEPPREPIYPSPYDDKTRFISYPTEYKYSLEYILANVPSNVPLVKPVNPELVPSIIPKPVWDNLPWKSDAIDKYIPYNSYNYYAYFISKFNIEQSEPDCNINKFLWLYNWAGYECISLLDKNRDCPLLNKLQFIWKSSIFHPFASDSDVENILNKNRNYVIVTLNKTFSKNINASWLNSKYIVEQDSYHIFGDGFFQRGDITFDFTDIIKFIVVMYYNKYGILPENYK